MARPCGMDLRERVVAAGESRRGAAGRFGVSGSVAVAEMDLEAIMRRRLTVTGSTLRPLAAAQKPVTADQVAQSVTPLIEQGLIRPHVFKIFPLERAAEAHRLMEAGVHMGKIVLEVDHRAL